jgi:hypothetical protein
MSEEYCFIDAMALRNAGILTTEQYLHYLLLHFKGIRHPLDKLQGDILPTMDPFAASLRTLIFDSEPAIMDGNTRDGLNPYPIHG